LFRLELSPADSFLKPTCPLVTGRDLDPAAGPRCHAVTVLPSEEVAVSGDPESGGPAGEPRAAKDGETGAPAVWARDAAPPRSGGYLPGPWGIGWAKEVRTAWRGSVSGGRGARFFRTGFMEKGATGNPL